MAKLVLIRYCIRCTPCYIHVFLAKCNLSREALTHTYIMQIPKLQCIILLWLLRKSLSTEYAHSVTIIVHTLNVLICKSHMSIYHFKSDTTMPVWMLTGRFQQLGEYCYTVYITTVSCILSDSQMIWMFCIIALMQRLQEGILKSCNDSK
jgi:hypothetical protein